MAQELPNYDTMLSIANSYIEATVDEIITKKIQEAQEEIAHKLPKLAGKVSARIIQECMKMGKETQ
jgi:hypothetical protein